MFAFVQLLSLTHLAFESCLMLAFTLAGTAILHCLTPFASFAPILLTICCACLTLALTLAGLASTASLHHLTPFIAQHTLLANTLCSFASLTPILLTISYACLTWPSPLPPLLPYITPDTLIAQQSSLPNTLHCPAPFSA